MPAPRRSKIGYCDYSGGDLNFVLGCTPVSAGCANCYARCIYDRFGKDFSQVTIYPEKLERLLRWQPKPPYKRGPGSRPLAFVCDMSDLFHGLVRDEFIRHAFGVMADRSDVDWLVLTKRAMRMRMLLMDWCGAENVWLGVTVENDDNLWRIDELLKTPAAVRWVSLEPMLAPMYIGDYLQSPQPVYRQGGVRWGPVLPCPALAWLVIGAESGPNRRPFEKEWAWDVLDQCRVAGVPCFLKQDSGCRPGVPLLDREGKECKQWPEPQPCTG